MTRKTVGTDNKVVSLEKRTTTLRSKVLVDMLDYWQDLRPEGALPARADVDPRRIEGALPYAFVLERLTPGVVRLRVAGGHLADLMGMDVRSMPLSALFQHRDRNKLMGLMSTLFTGPRALELELSARGTGTRKSLRAEMMVLPLLDDTGGVTRALGCLVARGALPNPPYRFQIDAARETDIEVDLKQVRYSVQTKTPTPHVPRGELLNGAPAAYHAEFAEDRAPFASKSSGREKATTPTRSRVTAAPFLRVVK